MPVFIDDMFKYPMGQYRRMKMSHMIADSREELDQMARRIGVNTRWIQHAGSADEHYDISMSKRELAIRYGAVPVTMRQLSAMIMVRRMTGTLPDPNYAEVARERLFKRRKLRREQDTARRISAGAQKGDNE